ncbi:MAG: MBL fold metallo-hydrolase, partial [Bryobacteraceae bacterium]
MFQRTLAGLAALSMLTLVTGAAGAQPNRSSKDLRIVLPDVEGGASVLFVTPEGKSLLIDTGWPPSFSERHGMPTSADRIAAAAKSLGVTKIDYLIMTHY